MARPRKRLRPDDYSKLETLASAGMSQRLIASRLGIAGATFRRILADDARATDAFEAGRAVMETELVGALYRQATDPKNRNPTPAIFLLKSVFAFRDQPPPPIEESRVKLEVILPKALSEKQYGELIDVTPVKALTEAGING